MDKDTLRNKIYSKIDELPALPGTVTRLISLFEDKNSNIALITEVIQKEPSLTAKILRVANSAYYGFSQKISDMDRSVALLGFNMVKSLAVSIGVIKSLPSGNKNPISGSELWRHSVTVAILMGEMGKYFFDKKQIDSIFITGLLHDIGIVVFDQFFSDRFNEVLDRVTLAGRKELHKIEQEVIGSDHGEVGGMLLARWNFPSIISLPVAKHHQLLLEDSGNSKETALLKLADIISHYDILKDENIGELEEELNPLLKCLGVEQDFVFEASRFKDSAKDEITAFFNSII